MTEKARQYTLYSLLILLLIPALFINLGKMPLTSDEPTRAVVALEMNLSGNYVTPTIHGNYYYNKPPLYNWILAGLFKLANSQSEFIIRLPAVLSLLGFALTIFLFVRKHLNEKIGLISSLIFITSGRILFYDSQLGLIDLFYSWLTFTGFMVIYHYFNKQKYFLLFFLSYLITAVGALTKGPPSLVFQAVTLLVFFGYKKQVKKLFHWSHFVGIGLLILIVGGYFLLYSRYNSPYPYLKTLLIESTQRTPVKYGLLSSIQHIFLFPFMQLYHLAPWSLLIIFFFKKGLFKSVIQDPFVKFCFIILVSNIIVYWISPLTLPRYLYMLYPLLFIVFSSMYARADKDAPLLKKITLQILNVSAFIVILAGLAVYFLSSKTLLSPFHLKPAALIITLFLLAYYMTNLTGYRIILFAAVLLALRIGFNWFVIPYRYAHCPEAGFKKASIEVARLTHAKQLIIHSWTPVDHTNIFYIEKEKQSIISREDPPMKKGNFYIMNSSWIKQKDVKNLYNFYSKPDSAPISLIFYE